MKMTRHDFHADSSRELHQLLDDFLKTRHLAQPIQSIDVDWTRAESPVEFDSLTVVGVRDGARTIGFIRAEALDDENWRETIAEFDEGQIVESDSPMLALLSRLAEQPWLFVRTSGRIEGFISRSDLQRPPFRMLLFGLISLFEMRLLFLVEQGYSDPQIENTLTENRLEKVRQLQADRRKRGEDLRLSECLQIADKRDLLLALPAGPADLGFDSHKKACRFFAKVESLRDRLVHANDLIGGSTWKEVLELPLQLTDFLSRTS